MSFFKSEFVKRATGKSPAAETAKNRKLSRIVQPTGVARPFGENELIVSKTDTTGRITYANDVFLRIALYEEHEVIGAPHSIVRHPDMPRAVFKLLWDTISGGEEIFAYVVNLAKNGDHYWVFAHVTPTFDESGKIIGYHSNRRAPAPEQVETVGSLYRDLLQEEKRYDDRKAGLQASYDMLVGLLSEKGVDYDEFVFSI